MFETDRKIHNRHSLRKKWFDYSKPGLFFITICTYRRKHLFGQVIDRHLVLNDAGRVAHTCWENIPLHFPDVKLHGFIVMPNHVHGLIETVHKNSEYASSGVEKFPEYLQYEPSGAENFQPQNIQITNQYQKIIFIK